MPVSISCACHLVNFHFVMRIPLAFLLLQKFSCSVLLAFVLVLSVTSGLRRPSPLACTVGLGARMLHLWWVTSQCQHSRMNRFICWIACNATFIYQQDLFMDDASCRLKWMLCPKYATFQLRDRHSTYRRPTVSLRPSINAAHEPGKSRFSSVWETRRGIEPNLSDLVARAQPALPQSFPVEKLNC